MCGRVAAADVKQECQLSMMRKFGKLVDMDALMTIGGNRRLEELKQEKQLKETEHSMEIKQSAVCFLYYLCVHIWIISIFSLFCFKPLIDHKGKPENIVLYYAVFLFVFFLRTQDKLDEARQTLNEVVIHNTKLLCQKRSFIDQRRELEQKITLRQKKLVNSRS